MVGPVTNASIRIRSDYFQICPTNFFPHCKYDHAVRLPLAFFDMKSVLFQIPKYLKPDMEID